jgi:fumarate reductase flavoprotein subunit
MVQGGYNAVLRGPDSLEAHFLDTLKGGGFLNDQELAWRLVETAPARVAELENRYGCFFDRDAAGAIHQKPFAGQSHDRTIHKGDLTGIEIMNRLTEQVWARANVRVLEEHRALELLGDGAGRIGGALLLDIRTGAPIVAGARATLLACGGGPTMYRVVACSADKSADGIALACRAGAALRDMEMVQFHPTGLVVPGSLMTGALLEEACAGQGADSSTPPASAIWPATIRPASSARPATWWRGRATWRSSKAAARPRVACGWTSRIWAPSSSSGTSAAWCGGAGTSDSTWRGGRCR